MDDNRYIFDKRVVKAHFRKYGLIMLSCLPILIAINVAIGKRLQSWVVIIIDVVVALAIIFILDLIVNYFQNKKMIKAEEQEKPKRNEKNKY